MKTSVDAVSENSERFASVLKPALRYTDYCILNEIEAGKTCGIEVRDAQGRLNSAGINQSAVALLAMGVREVAVIHFPEGAHARTAAGEVYWHPSLKLPEGYIAGSAGAGDAFCAGMLLGLHEGWELRRCMLTGVCAAAASMADATCTAGIVSLASCLDLAGEFGFRPARDMGVAV
jgi:sugar/nucleoside kinase (ribokinase family)